MIDSAGIYEKACGIRRAAEQSDLFRTAEDLGIEVILSDRYENLLGMYVSRLRHRFIFLNSRLDGPLQQMVLAHEIGHDQLHRKLASDHILQEFTLFRMTSRTEYEANAFAAHLLLDDQAVLERIYAGLDVSEIAGDLGVDINLLLIKIQELNRIGSDFRLPFEPDSTFFRNIKC